MRDKDQLATDNALMDTFNRRVERRTERRDFFRSAGAFAAGAAGMAALSACGGGSSSSTTPAVAQTTAISDADILNFALNLEYLEASFYLVAAGRSPNEFGQTGTGTQGAINTSGGGAVPFANAVVGAYAKEIAQDELNHVLFLRSALGNAAVASPAIDVSVSATSAFSTAAQAAGLVPAGTTFNPYGSDLAFLLGAFIFEDVGVTAYHGAAPLISNKTYLDAAAGILAVEAYHAGIVRTSLFAMGAQTPAITVGSPAVSISAATQAIAGLRDSLDGSATSDDRGVGTVAAPTLLPVDANSIAYDRTTGQVLNIVYGTKAAATKGLFFPNGVNGTINASTAET